MGNMKLMEGKTFIIKGNDACRRVDDFDVTKLK
jgi:hypothetical protein